MRLEENFFQTKLLSRLSHKVSGLLTLPSYWVSSLFSNPCQCKNLSFPGLIQPSRSEELENLCRYLSVPTNITSLLQWSQDSGSITSSTISTVVKRLASLQNKRTGIKYDVYCFEVFMASSSLDDVTFVEHKYVIGLFFLISDGAVMNMLGKLWQLQEWNHSGEFRLQKPNSGL